MVWSLKHFNGEAIALTTKMQKDKTRLGVSGY